MAIFSKFGTHIRNMFLRFRFLVFLLLLTTIVKAQWSALPFNTGYTNIAVSFINTDTGFVSSGIWQGPPPGINRNMLYKTVNGGYNWQTVFNDSSGITPVNQLSFFTDNSGIYKRWGTNVTKTTDGGLTGTTILSTGSSSSYDRFQALDSLQYVFSRDNYVYYTLNGGISWTTRFLAVPDFTNENTFAQFADLKNGFVWGSTYYSSPPVQTIFRLYKTTDSCQTTQLLFSLTKPGGFYETGSRVKFLSATTAVMTLDNIVIRTEDFGSTWDTVYTTNLSTWISMDSKGSYVVIGGTNGSLLTSVDSGLTFQSAVYGGAGLNITDVSVPDDHSEIFYATCGDGTILKYAPIGTSVAKNKKNDLTLYPNPVSGILYLSSGSPLPGPVTVDVFDLAGSLIESSHFDAVLHFRECIDMSRYKNGCYVFRISSESGMHYFKIIKQ